MNIIATIPHHSTDNADRAYWDKPLGVMFTVLAIENGKIQHVADLRICKGRREATFRAFAKDRGLQFIGSGRATGGGYNLLSSSAAQAFQAAGIMFNEGISGRGEGVVKEALKAIGDALGYSDVTIVEAW